MDRPLHRLRYVNADDLGDERIDFDGMHVESPTGEHLGDVDGFIVDSNSARPYYIVVDAGGWFKSKHLLVPVGHARLEADREALVTDLDRDRIDRFPGFDKAEFPKLSGGDMKRLNDEICQACTIGGVAVAYSTNEPLEAAWDRPDYRYPDWWHAEPYRPERMGAAGVTAGVESHQPSASAAGSDKTGRTRRAGRGADPSPHFDGRAQPGDVLGVETGGERTHVGDTAEDENERRRDAENDVAKLRE